ncbi:GAF domain-containing sensor histidine kinase [Longimicrobium sp.]|uniref:GAF domain-containing sensor histidine kinase n=1 Tax=Longimicrobium sp. TaxID=2029185 RepID=UPI002E302B61|nr:GAF domain-containing sensor histidine kinase [Longimicrobium sp.]HEX6037371.1 GAF domain-containing sensor histidine kinase [Longimicrobium sp.]
MELVQDPETTTAAPPSLMEALGNAERLAVLAATGLLDTPPEEAFDRLTRLAAEFLDAPLAQVNLLDDQRQFSKSSVVPEGWPEDPNTPLADCYCKWAVAERAPIVVTDARTDPRTCDTGALRDHNLVSYLGIPLIMSSGHALGTLCVAGFEPREWTAREMRVLSDLSASAANEVEMRLSAAARRELARMKEEFVSIVAHELRTPLTSIRGSLGLLASGRLDGTPQARRMLQIAAQNSDRLVRLINDMLDLDRMHSGRLEMEMGLQAVEPLVQQAMDAVQGAATELQVRMEARMDPGLRVWGDADRIVQVLVNLLSNAAKFSDPGALVEVIAEDRGSNALFQVRDRGRGIPADRLDDIFERFRQVDSSDARDKGGTGLGLAICRTIVQQHGGRIWVASEWGKGSTFFFTIPKEARDDDA